MLIPWHSKEAISVSECTLSHHQSIIQLSPSQVVLLPCYPTFTSFYFLNNHVWMFSTRTIMLFWLFKEYSRHTFLWLSILIAAFSSPLMDLNIGDKFMSLFEISSSRFSTLSCDLNIWCCKVSFILSNSVSTVFEKNYIKSPSNEL